MRDFSFGNGIVFVAFGGNDLCYDSAQQADGKLVFAALRLERARYATTLLRQGRSILDVVYEAGYYDQPHLTRALKQFIGLTPAQITDHSRDMQLSFLYKTAPTR